MKVELYIPVRAFSINRYNYATRKVKTAEARAWEAQILHHVGEAPALKEMAEKWRKEYGVFQITIIAIFKDFWNAHGQVSRKTIDVTNYEKPLQDLIFRHMGLNDADVVRLLSPKIPGPEDAIRIRLEFIAKDEAYRSFAATGYSPPDWTD